MAGVRVMRRQPPRRAAPADPESARRSKREREEARAAKLPPVSVLSTPTLTVETMHLSLAYNLRTRKVFVPEDEKLGPPVYSKREQHTYDTSSQTLARQEGTVEAALEHYNRLHKDEHELVKAVDGNSFYFNGPLDACQLPCWLKGGTICVELVPRYFFAELTYDPNQKGFPCVSCVKMDPADPETAPVRGCRICESRIFHPAAGGHRGALTPHPADAKNEEDKPGPKTIKGLFDLWVCKMQQFSTAIFLCSFDAAQQYRCARKPRLVCDDQSLS